MILVWPFVSSVGGLVSVLFFFGVFDWSIRFEKFFNNWFILVHFCLDFRNFVSSS